VLAGHLQITCWSSHVGRALACAVVATLWRSSAGQRPLVAVWALAQAGAAHGLFACAARELLSHPRSRCILLRLADVLACVSVGKRSPILGYNHNVRYRGLVFHVQTEDSGVLAPHVFTHLFYEGVILSTRKLVYDAGG
jgi:hypothetical protein